MVSNWIHYYYYYSATLQFLPYLAAKMSHPPDEDRRADVHGGAVPHGRGHDFILWDFEAVSEQGPVVAADGVPDYEGAGF